MPEQPPLELTALLERLKLADTAQVSKLARRVARLSRDLPRFESVWVDALVQARLLTPFQATEIHAGRGQRLQVGPYVLYERMAHPHYVACYRAREIDSNECVRLAVVENVDAQTADLLPKFEALAAIRTEQHGTDKGEVSCCTDGSRLFWAEPWLEGQIAAPWIVHHGRIPPTIVLEIARGMLAQLLELDRQGIYHGDIGISSLLLGNNGDVRLVLPGLRGILRPKEGYANADLIPEAYDSLAPERIDSGKQPDIRSEIYACGCVWWHLLCGRPPIVGGNSLAKLRAAQLGRISDVRRYAMDVPPALAAAISACLEQEPSRRPESLARLSAMLGPSTRNGKEALADYLARAGRATVPWTTTARAIRQSSRTPLWSAVAVCTLAVAVALLWPAWPARQASTNMAVEKKEAKHIAETHLHRIEPATVDTDLQTTSEPAEPEVVRTAYEQKPSKPLDLVLPSDQPIEAGTLRFCDSQCVRADDGHRATVRISNQGLLVANENVHFQNIDFVWSDANALGSDESALIELRAGRAEFTGCTFRCELNTAPCSAVHWLHPSQPQGADYALPSGRLRMANCILHQVGIGIDCQTIGAMAVELHNVLLTESGPLVRLDHCPVADEPLTISLLQVTLRDSGALLECLVPRFDRQPGEITVQATACAFVPQNSVPLMRFWEAKNQNNPTLTAAFCDRLLAAVRWSGQGSLVSPETPIIAWATPEGEQQVLNESRLSVAGLVRSEVGFVGATADDPTSSRLERWQAPLQSAEPPGVDPAQLPQSDQRNMR